MATAINHSADTFTAWAQHYQARIEQVLEIALPQAMPLRLHDAMRYSVLGGGKRVRALLCYASAELVGVSATMADNAAAAVELIHAFSLVHDDMPCMDDDDLRRGKPSCHKQYDDATALLVGDALQSLAFELLSAPNYSLAATQQLQQIQCLAYATGSRGMCGGQSIDLDSTGKSLSLSDLETMHQHKTGALIEAAVLMGAHCVNDISPETLNVLTQYSQRMGLAFQVVDDILDHTADSATLGKTAGKDEAQNKSTYVRLMGLSEAQALVNQLHSDSLRLLAPFGERAKGLRLLTDFITQRSF